MYKLFTADDTVRIPPRRFGEDLSKVIISELSDLICGKVEKNLGVVIAVMQVKKVSEGKIILGDGAAYYNAVFEVLVYQPKINEVVEGTVTDITEFGAFVNVGPIDCLIHVSQIAEDFMNYDQKNVMFVGRETNKSLKREDHVRARIVTVSMKDNASNSKIGLTMRQPYLGKLEWLEAEKKENAEGKAGGKKSAAPKKEDKKKDKETKKQKKEH